tara:strand:+ start:1382 stop:1849 length:468 start_codon:yes stop_codon:yes gene_type:complete
MAAKCRHNYEFDMSLTRIFCLIALLIAPCYSHALNIVSENLELEFPGTFLAGTSQIATSNPEQTQIHVVRFYVEGDPGRRINVSVSNGQYLYHSTSSRSLKIGKVFYGCGLSVRGRATISRSGKSDLLCIGAQVRINHNDPAGIYSATIPFEVNY